MEENGVHSISPKVEYFKKSKDLLPSQLLKPEAASFPRSLKNRMETKSCLNRSVAEKLFQGLIAENG